MTDDRPASLDVVRRAFSGDGRDGAEEVDIVERCWALPDPSGTIDLVATHDEVIVGHVLVTVGAVGATPVPGLAPLAVDARHQRAGVGSRLVWEALLRAEAAGWPAVVLLGDPAYYLRFGFEPAGPLGVAYPAVGADHPAFQLRRLTRYTASLRGDYAYSWEQ